MLKLSPTETKSYPHSIVSTITTLSTGSSTFTQAKLPKIPLPTFKGDPLKWGIFWQSFSTNIHENSRLDDHQKELTYIRQAIHDPATAPLLNRSTTSPCQYEDLVVLLKEIYDQKHLINAHHTMSIVNCPSVSKGTHEELSLFESTILHSVSLPWVLWTVHLSARAPMKSCRCLRALFSTVSAVLKDTGQFEIGPFVTSILISELPKNLADQWLLFTKDIAEVPESDIFLNFLKHKKKTTSPAASFTAAKPELIKEQPRWYKVPVHAVQPAPFRDRTETWTACSRERHPLYSCWAISQPHLCRSTANLTPAEISHMNSAPRSTQQTVITTLPLLLNLNTPFLWQVWLSWNRQLANEWEPEHSWIKAPQYPICQTGLCNNSTLRTTLRNITNRHSQLPQP